MLVVEISCTTPLWRLCVSAVAAHVADDALGAGSAGSTKGAVFAGYRDVVDDINGTSCVNNAK